MSAKFPRGGANLFSAIRLYIKKSIFAFLTLSLPNARLYTSYGRPWPAVYINFVLKIHQIQVLTEPLCLAQASFYALPNNERGTKYRGLTYSARQNCP